MTAAFGPSRIDNASVLVAVFGYWPSFHDAEVLAIRLDRSGVSGGPELEADIHVFEMTSTVTPDGLYELRHHTLVTLRFEGVDELSLEGFNNQNALMGLQIEDISSRQLELLKWEVTFDAAFGLDASFLCRGIAVASAKPFNPSRSRPQSSPRPEP